MDQFRNDPELQSRVMDDHIADFNSRIDKDGLSAYEGTTVGGVPVTRGSMIAMAHLGGYGGMRKFLESDGEYNPSDELGTSLADYALKHSGPTKASTPEARTNKLSNFSVDADGRALGLRSMAESVITDGFSNSMQGNVQPPKAGLAALDGEVLPPGVGPAMMPPATQLGWGSAVPQGADPFEANGMPKPIRMGPAQLSFGGPAPAGAPPGFSINPAETAGYSTGVSGGPSISTSNAGEAAPEEEEARNGFINRIGQTLFPDDEDPGGKFKNMMGALGVGLGQMSAGRPVDLQPYFANVAAQKRALIEGEQAQKQQEIDNQISAMNADTQRMNAETAYLRFQNEVAQAAKEGRPLELGLSPETIQKYGQMPTAAPFIEMMNSPDEEVQKLGMQGFKEAILKDTQQGAARPEAISDLYTALNNGDTDAVAEILRDNPISTEDFKRVADITDPGVAMKNAMALADSNADPEIVDTFMKLARLGGGLSDNQFAVDNYKEGREFYGELLSQVNSGRSLNFNVNTLRSKMLNEAASGRTVEGFQEDYMAPFLAAARRVLPSDWTNRLEDTVGLSPAEYQKMDALSKFIVLEAARPLMQGQGTVTDSERAQLAQSLTAPNLEFEAQMSVLDRLAVLGEVDVALANYYRSNQSDQFHGNFHDLRGDIELETTVALPALYASRETWTAFKNLEASGQYRSEFKDEEGNLLPPAVLYAKLAPTLSPKQFQMFRGMLTEELWIDSTTNQLMKGNRPFGPSSN